MQLIYRGVRVNTNSASQQISARKPMGVYRGVALSLDGDRKSNLNSDEKHNLKYRGVSYEH